MAANALAFYHQFKEDLGKGLTDLDSDTLKVALLTSAYTPDAAHDEYSDLTNEVANGNGYVTGGATLTGVTFEQTAGVAKLDSDDVSWTASGGNITFRYAVLYNSTDGKLIGYILLDNTPANITILNGNTYTLQIPANGWFTLT